MPEVTLDTSDPKLRETLLLERWLPVPGYEGLYQVSDAGRIRGRRGLLRSWVTAKGGHLRVALSANGVRKDFYIHRLALLAFAGEPGPGQECRHLDGDPSNNRLSNLAWGTVSENQLDRVRHGNHHEALKTHCPAGHAYDEPNTYVRSCGGRICRACNTRQHRERAEARQTEGGSDRG